MARLRMGSAELAEAKVGPLLRAASEPVLSGRVALAVAADPAVACPAVAKATIDVNGRVLLKLCEVIHDRYDGQVGLIGRRFAAYPECAPPLDALPGWGRMIIRLFLRELWGLRPGADPPLDERAAPAARHLGLVSAQSGVSGLGRLASAAGLDLRDLESGLVRLDLAHGRAMTGCPGGQACAALRQPVPPGVS